MGVENRITVDGLQRKYIEFVPANAKGPFSVVVLLHGGGSNGRLMEGYSKFDDTAQHEGMIALYPDSVEGNWNDGRNVPFIPSQRDRIDDVKFIRALIDDVAQRNSIDRSRIFAAGISNGAMMSHRLAAEASDLVAGIAVVAGGMAPSIAESFHPKFPVSVLIIQGNADPIVPFDGGDITLGGEARGKIVPTQDTLARYLKRNGNEGSPTISQLVSDPPDGTSAELSKYPDGPGGVKTWYCVIKNGGHTWPGRPPYLSESIIGKASQTFSASQFIAEFFKACPPRSTFTTSQ